MMIRRSFLAFCVALVLVAVVAVVPGARLSAAQKRGARAVKKVARYSCPMHPEVVRSKQGRCPKCSMALRLVKEDATTTTTAAAAPPPPPAPLDESARPNIPEARVLDQNGERLSFYTDLVRGKTVAINFIFTTCTTICPPLTATFRRVQQQLGGRADVRLISISVDPTTDTPERLKAFASKFKADAGWSFVTGEKPEIDRLLVALGASVSERSDHTPTVLVFNDVTGKATRAYGLAPPTQLVKIINETADGK